MKKDLKEETLKKIQGDNIKIKPRWYFKLSKILIYTISAILVIAGTYLFNLMFYLPMRTLRIAEKEGFGEYISLFPWPLIIIGGVIVGVIIYLYRHYEGGYKKHLGITAVIISVLIISGGIVIAKSNLNEKLEERPRLKHFYEWNDKSFIPDKQRQRLYKNLNYNQPNMTTRPFN